LDNFLYEQLINSLTHFV